MDSKANVRVQPTVIVLDDSDDESPGLGGRSFNKRPFKDDGGNAKKPKLEKGFGRASFGGNTDDCEVLPGRPEEPEANVGNHQDDDDADVMVTGARGDGAALRDLPHSRHQCGSHSFVKKKSAQNAQCCKQCFCYVCDKPRADCPLWGTGIIADDHCNAYDSWDWQRKRSLVKSLNRIRPTAPHVNSGPHSSVPQSRPTPQPAIPQTRPTPQAAIPQVRPTPAVPSVKRPSSASGQGSGKAGPSKRPEPPAAARRPEWSAENEDPRLDADYIYLGTISIPIASRAAYDLNNLPPEHGTFSLGLFHMDMLPVKGATYKKFKMVHFRFDTGEQDLPRSQRTKANEFDILIGELKDRLRNFNVDRKPTARVVLTVLPSEDSPRRGIVKIKVFQQRVSIDESNRLPRARVLMHLCKEDAVFREQIEELRQLELDASVRRIRSFDALLARVQSTGYLEEEQPEGLAVTLRPYQKQSLRFMLDTERREGGFHGLIWRQLPGAGTPEEDVYFCHTRQRLKIVKRGELPPATTGGFLCEEMGLGKTVEILGLILANPHPDPPALVPQISLKQPLPPIPTGGVPSKATLVVCAVSLVGQWISEAQGKLTSPVAMYKYHGSSRSSDPFFLARQDIVVTTYGIVGSDFSQHLKRRWDDAPLTEEEKRRMSPLHNINWWRIVLDESHTVKDPKVQHSRACAELKGDRRWCCTGTPINTSISDLFGQFCFLKLSPFNEMAVFNKEIGQPFESSSHGRADIGTGKTVLVDLLTKIMVRHTKSQKINGEELLVLPAKTNVNMPVRFTPEERAVYDRAQAQARKRFAAFRKLGPAYIGKHMLQIMALLLPMRRMCSGGQIYLPQDGNQTPLAREDDDAEAGPLQAAGPADRPPESECGICFDVMERPARTPCNHWFCGECLTTAIESGPSREQCPLCRQKVTTDDIVQGEARGTSMAVVPYTGPGDTGMDEAGPSGPAPPFVSESKLKALLEDLERTRETDPTAKALIFSQFMGTIDWLKEKLTEAGVSYRYISGDMTLNKRAKAIEQFQQNPPTTVFLLSIRTGAVGITLTSASVVYLLEPVLNPALEEQAVGRAWRMGQQRPVTVKRMFIEDSIEEKILEVVRSRVEGGNGDDANDDVRNSKHRSKDKGKRLETIAGSIRSDKQNLRMSEFEILFG